MSEQHSICSDKETKPGLCSSCGLCMCNAWPTKESIQGCVFTTGWLGKHEQNFFGRERSLTDADEIVFGISKDRFCARMKNPDPRVQFTGIITSIAKKAFTTEMVEAVVTLHRSKEDYFFPEPVLARSIEDIVAGCGSKPVLAQTLISLEKAYQAGIKRLLVIGAPCHIHNVRAFQERYPYLKNIEIYVVGIPCTDNIKPENLRYILSRISRSHETVRHYEFMQDFTVHLYHENGDLERVPFFSLPPELTSAGVLTSCCRSCFDYMNSLADITVGYLGAPLDIEKMNQWVLIRTEKGEELCSLIADDMETFPEVTTGDRKDSVQYYGQQLLARMQPGNENEVQQSMSLEDGHEFAEYLYSTGPRDAEFARYAIDTHLIRNYYYVKQNYPQRLKTLVPRHVYKILKDYELTP
jgi:coenzyme F420 hydrogenase subunit beta